MIRRGLLAALIAAAVVQVPAKAHRLDEYLQAARIAIAGDRIAIEIDLTPGVAIAERVAGEIDSDRDGRFSPSETEAYARKALAAMTLTADGRAAPLSLDGHIVPDREAMLEGLGTIRLRATAMPPASWNFRHTLDFHNGFRPEMSVYLANAMMPDDARLTIASQTRDPLQQRLTIDYEMASMWRGAAAGAALIAVAWTLIVRRRKAVGRAA